MTAVKVTDANLAKLKEFKIRYRKEKQLNINFQDMVNALIERTTYEAILNN